MKSLVIVTKSLAPYRVRFYQEVANELTANGWKVALFTATAGSTDHPWEKPADKTSDMEIITCGNISGSLLKSIGRNTKANVALAWPNRRMLESLREKDPDVVWTHEYSPFCLTASIWALLFHRLSLLSTDLGDNPPAYACSRIGLWFHRMASFLFRGVIAQTAEATRRPYHKKAPVVFAPHAIDTSEYFPNPSTKDQPYRFLFTGSLDDRKGIQQVIYACRKISDLGLPFELRVLGTGPLAAWLAEQPDPWISIGGFVEGAALRKEYHNAHAYVLPTRGDTYAVTVHEAAASGLPLIIGRSAGAVETLVVDKVSGFAIDPENINEIAQKMEYLLRNQGHSKQMGMAARKLAESHDVRQLARKTANFIMDMESLYTQ